MFATIKSALDGLLNAIEHVYDVPCQPADITYDTTRKRIADLDFLQSELEVTIQDVFTQKTDGLKKLLPKLARQHNDALPINRLPPEVLALILGFAIPRDPNHDAMDIYHLLAQVCKLWFEVIINDPWFWPVINVRNPERINMVLKRNKNFPDLKMWCRTSSKKQLLSFLPIVRESSPRWTKVYFAAHLLDSVKQILEGPTTRLSELYIRPARGTVTPSHHLVQMSEGAPFKIVELDNVAVSWDCQRLQGSRLQSLQLFNLYHSLPTLKQLHAILSSSPNLKWVGLQGWEDAAGDAAGAFTADDMVPIYLPHLQTLYLQGLPAAYMSHLVSRITGDNLRTLHTSEVPSSLWALDSGGGPSLFKILTRPVKTFRKLQIIVSTGRTTLRLASDPAPSVDTSEWSVWRKDSEGFDVTFNIQTLPHSLLETLSHFLSSSSHAESISLFLDAQEHNMTDHLGHLIPTPSFDPEVVISALPFVTHVQFGRYYDAGSVLRYLSAPQGGLFGTNDWPWKDLVSCDVRDVERPISIVRDLLHFSQERMRASTGSGSAENGPKPVPKAQDQVLMPQKLSTVFSHVDCLKDIVRF